ncbi:C1 family peptidase [Nitrobacter sp.]|uniref:C1 family peptidase n=1 Tax=Nitrobacter sp. TaxID=29420 RepID=UPI0029CAADBE|nr:C1 family peptidase [Nitrobacter sp.]
MSNISVSVDLRACLGPARNQGPRPTCLAFAASDAHAAVRAGWRPLSCEYAFYQAQRRAGRPPNTGALLSAMLEALRKDGQPEENGWPYLAATPANSSWTPPTEVGQLFGRNSMLATHSIDQVIQELDRGRAVIVLMMLSRAFYQRNPQGIIDPPPDEQPEPERRHAVVAVGHGIIDGQRAVLVRNSWGPSWGDAGYGWLTERFLGPRIYAAATLLEDVDVSAHSAAA